MCQNGKALFKQEIRTGLLCVNIVSNQSQAKQHSLGKAKSKLAWSKSIVGKIRKLTAQLIGTLLN